VELGSSEAHRRRAFVMLEAALRRKGWLFFFTHDVGATPTDYGAPTDLIEELAVRALEGGAILAAPTLGAVLSGVID